MISFRPSAFAVRRALGVKPLDLASAAADRWQIAPAETRFVRPAIILPGQLERVRGAEFGSVADVLRDFRGGFDAVQGATMGFRVLNVDLVDGVLYAQNTLRHLRPREIRAPAYLVPAEVASGALYESWVGNRWFGNWLSEDCLTYRLAEAEGAPVATSMTAIGHVSRYEALLGIAPRRVDRGHFNELIVFQDSSHNTHRQERTEDLRRRLISTVPWREHAGVFLSRGHTGDRRLLTNEAEIAERLAGAHGFTVIDPIAASVEELISACAGARVVAGVEGSQLVHGLMVMPPRATLLAIQPPERAVSVLKMVTDRQGQDFAVLVGSGGRDQFSVDLTELERTLELVAGSRRDAA